MVMVVLNSPSSVDPALVEATLPLDMGAYDLFNRELEQGNPTQAGKPMGLPKQYESGVGIRSPDAETGAQEDFGISCYNARDYSVQVAT